MLFHILHTFMKTLNNSISMNCKCSRILFEVTTAYSEVPSQYFLEKQIFPWVVTVILSLNSYKIRMEYDILKSLHT